MKLQLFLEDVRHILMSKRMSYSIIIMAVFAFMFALFAEFSPENLKLVLEAGLPGTTGLFEYIWFENVLDKFFLLVIVSYGAFMLCDLEDDGTIEIQLSRSVTRAGLIARRTLASLATFFLLFVIVSLIALLAGLLIVGNLDAAAFMAHHFLVFPMCLFVFSLTFFLSVPLRQTTTTVIASFAISLALSFLYTFMAMGGETAPSILNPLALGHRILLALPLEGAILVALVSSGILFGIGTVWFMKKDI